jgi:hypothetical protein
MAILASVLAIYWGLGLLFGAQVVSCFGMTDLTSTCRGARRHAGSSEHVQTFTRYPAAPLEHPALR